MSVTFSVEGLEEERGFDLPCPDCGISIGEALQNRPSLDCSCGGYGGPEKLPIPRHELNVANGNAAAILRHLALESDDPRYLFGGADPKDILTAMETRHWIGLVSPDRRLGPNTIKCGRTPDQASGYYRTLRRIAKKAAKYGRSGA